MALFDNGYPEEFLLFIRNFQITPKASVNLSDGTNIHYLFTVLYGEALHQIDTLSVEVGITTRANLNRIILGLCMYFFPINYLPKIKRAMRRGMRKPRGLEMRSYATCIIDINYYLDAFPGSKSGEKLVRRNWMKFCLIVCKIDGAGKRICMVLIVKILLKNICKDV